MSAQLDFIKQISPFIQKYAPKYGIKVCSPIIAQAVIESRYGTSGLAKYHNYFGLKAGSNWKGKTVVKSTKEEYTVGTLTDIKATFRAYDSMEEGVIGYFEFIDKPRYQNLKGVIDTKLYTELLKADGYATSSTYVSTIMNTIATYNLTTYDTIASTSADLSVIDKMIQRAMAEEGYLEKKSNADLDDKTANAGSGNYTKYWRDLAPSSQGKAWCNAFVDWVFEKTFSSSTGKKLLYTPGSWSFYTPTSSGYFKNNKQWFTSNPQRGDIIYFKNSQRICHVGIVTGVDSSKVYTIEGNTSSKEGVIPNGGGVFKKSYELAYANIAGYGRPNWSIVGIQDTTNPSSEKEKPKKAFVGVVTASKLNIRKGPGSNYENLVSYPTLSKGTEVDVISVSKDSKNEDWYYIGINGSKGYKYGYASAKYIIKKA